MTASDSRNVVLTGFMGTGKTTVGRLLAEQLGYEFVDTDQVIEQRHGKVADIFRERGEEVFRTIEREVASELADRRRLVISTGGRMMLDPLNVTSLSRHGRIFCLVANPDAIFERLAGDPSQSERPLLSGPDPRRRIVELLAERAPAIAASLRSTPTGSARRRWPTSWQRWCVPIRTVVRPPTRAGSCSRRPSPTSHDASRRRKVAPSGKQVRGESEMAGSGSILGNAVLRLEDPTLLTGEGKYVDDLVEPGMLYVGLVRSPVAHGTINSLDLGEAASMPGVVAVFHAGNDLGMPAMQGFAMLPPDFNRPIFAADRVRFVGDVIAAVIAESQAQANDAAEADRRRHRPVADDRHRRRRPQVGRPVAVPRHELERVLCHRVRQGGWRPV